MKKPGEVVIKETKYISFFVIIFSVIMQIVFILLGKWDYTVLLGNLLSGAYCIINFLLMGIMVEKAVEKDEKDAKATIRKSQTLRQLALYAVAAMGALIKCFNIWATLIPLFFPRIAIALRPVIGNNKN